MPVSIRPIETVFLMASEKRQFMSSRLVKETGRLGGNIGQFVPVTVAHTLATRFEEERAAGAADPQKSAGRVTATGSGWREKRRGLQRRFC